MLTDLSQSMQRDTYLLQYRNYNVAPQIKKTKKGISSWMFRPKVADSPKRDVLCILGTFAYFTIAVYLYFLMKKWIKYEPYHSASW